MSRTSVITKDAAARIAVDWDGTCVEGVWPKKNGDWLPGATEALHKMLADGWRVVIHSSRLSPVLPGGRKRTPGALSREVRVMRKKLDRAGLEAVDIWMLPYKPPARYYIDDHAIRFTDWKSVMQQVRR